MQIIRESRNKDTLNFSSALALGGSKAMLVSTSIPVPLSIATPPRSVVSQTHRVCKGALLCIDFHPTQRNLVLCGSMDRTTFILNLFDERKEEEEEEDGEKNIIVQTFNDHTKCVQLCILVCMHNVFALYLTCRYVVRALWSRTGQYFVTASYDKTVCLYWLV